MSIGQNLKERRRELDMTLEDVAKEVGVSRQTLSRYETGVIGNIPSDKIEALAKALRTTPAFLMGWEQYPVSQCSPEMGSRIKAAREAKKLTQEELGIACGTTKQSIFKYETGVVTNIPLDRVEKIANALDVTPAFLMGWDNTADHFEIKKAPSVSDETKLLSSGEEHLINLYRDLNTEGQEKLVDYAEDLVAGGRYIKSDEAIVDKEA